MSVDISLWPIAIVEDRYGGVYSGGAWLAIANATNWFENRERVSWCLDDGPHGDDGDAMIFWCESPQWIAAAHTPEEALNKLRAANAPAPAKLEAEVAAQAAGQVPGMKPSSGPAPTIQGEG